MGIHCEIRVYKTQDGIFRPGDQVKGTIVYAVDTETIVNAIKLSLKGYGISDWSEGSGGNRTSYIGKEKLYSIETVILQNAQGEIIPVNSYTVHFDFTLPLNIPSSHKDFISKINHLIKIKFEKPGLNWNKRYQMEINVKGNVIPIDVDVPVMYGSKRRLLLNIDPLNDVNTINIKATKKQSLIKPGENMNMDIIIENHTSVAVKKVDFEIIEKYTYISNGNHKKVKTTTVSSFKHKDTIEKSKEKLICLQLTIPENAWTIQHSKVLKREYFVLVNAVLPFPCRNAKLVIPIDVGDICETFGENSDTNDVFGITDGDDGPPSYWEVMAEETEGYKDKLAGDVGNGATGKNMELA